MNNNEYWKQRFELLEEVQNKKSKQYLNTLKEEFEKSLMKIEKDINNWYTRIADNNEISFDNAKKLLDKKKLKEFRWTVEEYIKKGRENSINQKWMKELENASARVHINELESIKIQIQNELENLFSKQNKEVENLLRQQYEDSYYKSTYEIQNGLGQYYYIQKIDTNKIDKIISKPWTIDNNTFSDRIWNNKQQLVDTLQKELIQATIRGDELHNLVKKIEKDFKVSKGKAGRLVMTEAAFFSSAGQKDCFNSLNVKQYEIVATLDSHTSEICQKLDGKVFDMKDYEVGITAPPFHCNCRTTTAPYFNDEFTEGEQRAYRDEDGKTKYVDSNIKYKEWKEKYVSEDEDVISNIFSKKNNDKLKDITNKKEQIINNSFKNENIKNIALNTEIKTIKTGGNKSYHMNGNIVLKDKYTKRTVIHEIGHIVDYNNKWLSANKDFINAINEDKEYVLKNKNTYKILIKRNKEYRQLSDIISGMTKNAIRGMYYHKTKYWNKPNKLEREIFAQMFTIAGKDDINQLEIIKKYFPNTFREFDNLIGRLL